MPASAPRKEGRARMNAGAFTRVGLRGAAVPQERCRTGQLVFRANRHRDVRASASLSRPSRLDPTFRVMPGPRQGRAGPVPAAPGISAKKPAGHPESAVRIARAPRERWHAALRPRVRYSAYPPAFPPAARFPPDGIHRPLRGDPPRGRARRPPPAGPGADRRLHPPQHAPRLRGRAVRGGRGAGGAAPGHRALPAGEPLSRGARAGPDP